MYKVSQFQVAPSSTLISLPIITIPVLR
uniref:Uncharacterized protein n=1 Tax=Rhizophora mucronata TaxID=61149 RepID=A0A2P2QJ78_RHIMU